MFYSPHIIGREKGNMLAVFLTISLVVAIKLIPQQNKTFVI